MIPAASDTYGSRIEKYQRREQMTIWVAAGIAALVAFIGTHALDNAPRYFTQVVLTTAVLAGVALALSRVGFEWRATLLKRKTTGHFTLADTPLEASDQPWPTWPERSWIVCLALIATGWTLMIVGMWLPRSTTEALTPQDEHSEAKMFLLGIVGPFADCSVKIAQEPSAEFKEVALQYADLAGTLRQSSLIVLVGIADNQRLSPACVNLFGTNEHLAAERARYVRLKLEGVLLGKSERPHYAILTSGPRHLEANQEGRQQDRSVEVWAAVGVGPLSSK